IIASADFMTLTILEVAKELNIAIPEQLGVCGYSNEPYTELTTPAISTVNQFSFEMGKTVANMYFQENKSDEKTSMPKSIIINPKLIVRASSQRNI
ncbi:MAG: substrate-binding domain-containing protein, partial [Pedobacter sp.]|nr:substrate-binding domain-containing protein [Chitinophagaceae bacterium]